MDKRILTEIWIYPVKALGGIRMRSSRVMGWGEAEFLRRTEGSAIRRIGYRRWRRNLAVALGNAWRASGDPAVAQALAAAREAADELVREHVDWALAQR